MNKDTFDKFIDSVDEALEGAAKFMDEAIGAAEDAFSEYVKTPDYNTVVVDDKFVVELAVPGYDAEEVDVTIHDGNLVVTASRAEGTSNRFSTFASNSVRHEVSLPRRARLDTVDAMYANGVVRVSFKVDESDIKIALVDRSDEVDEVTEN